jgi:hypothetical protein
MRHDLRTSDPVISIVYKHYSAEKSAIKKNKLMILPKKHIIHKAIKWEKMLDDGVVESLSQIAKKEGLTRARVTQIMNLVKLPTEFKEFLLGLDDPKEIRKYSERKIRKMQPDSLAELRANSSLPDLILGGKSTIEAET